MPLLPPLRAGGVRSRPGRAPAGVVDLPVDLAYEHRRATKYKALSTAAAPAGRQGLMVAWRSGGPSTPPPPRTAPGPQVRRSRWASSTASPRYRRPSVGRHTDRQANSRDRALVDRGGAVAGDLRSRIPHSTLVSTSPRPGAARPTSRHGGGARPSRPGHRVPGRPGSRDHLLPHGRSRVVVVTAMGLLRHSPPTVEGAQTRVSTGVLVTIKVTISGPFRRRRNSPRNGGVARRTRHVTDSASGDRRSGRQRRPEAGAPPA